MGKKKSEMVDQVGITISKEQQITYVRKECSYIITSRDWKRLKKTLERAHALSNVWSNVAWGTLGIGSSCLTSYFTGDKATWLLVVGCTTMGVAICSFICTLGESRTHQSSIEGLKEVVQEIEDAIVSKESQSRNEVA